MIIIGIKLKSFTRWHHMKGIIFHFECYLSISFNQLWLMVSEVWKYLVNIENIYDCSTRLASIAGRGSSIVRVNIRFFISRAKVFCRDFGNRLLWKLNMNRVPRQLVYRHIVYDTSSTDISSLYCIPASSSVIHPTSVSANHYFHQFQLLVTLWFTFTNPASTDTTIIQHTVSKHCGMTIQLVLSVKDAYFHKSHF